MAKSDGATYPLCPGVEGGNFNPDEHKFVNLSVSEIVSELRLFIKKLRKVNPKSKVILTVSPVPLVATAVDQHVLVSTTYSKSVLRVAAEEIASSLDEVAYFPSYEIITGGFSRGRYFAADGRTVQRSGVEHVMHLLLKHYTTNQGQSNKGKIVEDQILHENHIRDVERLVQLNCDEAALDK